MQLRLPQSAFSKSMSRGADFQSGALAEGATDLSASCPHKPRAEGQSRADLGTGFPSFADFGVTGDPEEQGGWDAHTSLPGPASPAAGVSPRPSRRHRRGGDAGLGGRAAHRPLRPAKRRAGPGPGRTPTAVAAAAAGGPGPSTATHPSPSPRPAPLAGRAPSTLTIARLLGFPGSPQPVERRCHRELG